MDLMPCPIEGCNAMIANQPNWHCPQCGGSKFGVQEQAKREEHQRYYSKEARDRRAQEAEAQKAAEFDESIQALKTLFYWIFIGILCMVGLSVLVTLWDYVSQFWK